MPGLLSREKMSSMHKLHIAESDKLGTTKESLGVQLLQILHLLPK